MLATVKAVMMLERKALLPNAGFEKFNKGIKERKRLQVRFRTLHYSFFVDLELKPSQVLQKVNPISTASPLRVCVTNFGTLFNYHAGSSNFSKFLTGLQASVAATQQYYSRMPQMAAQARPSESPI